MMNKENCTLPVPDLSLLEPAERIILSLRNLYSEYGYNNYRMSKFEEYDLYVRNKDYLISEGVITFTDTTGKLMALKPDVTLSIIKNTKDLPEIVQKLCYNENVYRVSKSTKAFRELNQAGIECLGAVDDACTSEVLLLAAKSLSMLSRDYVIEISDLDIITCFLNALTDDPSLKNELIDCISSKNIHGIRDIVIRESLPEEGTKRLIRLIETYGPIDTVLPVLESLCIGSSSEDSFKRLKGILELLKKEGADKRFIIDFSSVSDLKYYNGIIFKGFIKGIPGSVISGGQYDHLMKRMQKKSRAIGFAVYLDMLDGLVQ